MVELGDFLVKVELLNDVHNVLGEMIEITPDISELIQYYTVLSAEQKEIAIQLLKNMNHK